MDTFIYTPGSLLINSMVAGYSSAFSLDTCFAPLVDMGYGLAFLLAL